MMFWYGGGWGFWQLALMWVVTIGFWGLLIWGVWAMITGATRRPGGQAPSDNARKILDERLARGEIDAGEYQRLREVMAAGDGRRPAGTGSQR